MQSLYYTITKALGQALKKDTFWQRYLHSVDDARATYSLHVAVMVEPFLTYMLEGRKTVESRFSQRRTAPFNKIKPGDIILLKKAGGPIVAVCLAQDTWFYRLDPVSWKTIKQDFADYICAQDPMFWLEREKASFATLIKVGQVTPIKNISIEKRDRRGWVVLTPEQPSPLLPLYDSLEELNQTQNTINAIEQKSAYQLRLTSEMGDYCVLGFHTYHRSRRVNAKGYPVCKHCGADTIDWARLHQRDIAECDYTFAKLSSERLRCDWWTKELDAGARRHALKKGRSKLEEVVLNRLARSVGGANPAFDGRQTPKSGNVIFYAQHALACCCRKCIECWHGIPRGEILDNATLLYFTQLVIKFIELRIPELAKHSVERAIEQLD